MIYLVQEGQGKVKKEPVKEMCTQYGTIIQFWSGLELSQDKGTSCNESEISVFE